EPDVHRDRPEVLAVDGHAVLRNDRVGHAELWQGPAGTDRAYRPSGGAGPLRRSPGGGPRVSELSLAGRVLDMVRRLAGPSAEAEVGAYHNAEALTRFANSAIHQNGADPTTTVRLRLHLDGRTAGSSPTLTDTAGLEALIERTIAAPPLSPPGVGWGGLPPPTPLHAPAVEFDEATARATPQERAM